MSGTRFNPASLLSMTNVASVAPVEAEAAMSQDVELSEASETNRPITGQVVAIGHDDVGTQEKRDMPMMNTAGGPWATPTGLTPDRARR